MGLIRNNKNIVAIYRGEHLVTAAYRGEKQVFSTGVEWEGLTFTGVEDNSSVKYTKGDYESAEYSYNALTWYDANDVIITLNTNDKVYFRGQITSEKKRPGAYFTMTGKIAASGNMQSMLDSNMSREDVTTYCYAAMFMNCVSLTTAPELPATTLAASCYYNLFYRCTGLTSAPELPATTLVLSCYSYMFASCSRLKYIKAMCLTTPDIMTTTSWVMGVSSIGTFVKNAAATWNVVGVNGIPNGWTVEIATE